MFKTMFNKKSKIKVIKNRLTLREMLSFVNEVVENCFDQDEQGNDIGYSPIWKDATILNCFAEFYTDYTHSDDVENNYATYSQLNPYTSNIDTVQFNQILETIDSTIEFRKEKLLQKETPLGELLNEVTKVVKGYESAMNLEDMKNLLPQLAKLGEKGVDQKKMVEQILKTMPQDHKKATKKTDKKETKVENNEVTEKSE